MKILIIVFEKRTLFGSKEIIARFSVNATKEKIIFEMSDADLIEKVKETIDFLDCYLPSQGILEETSILERIKNRFQNLGIDNISIKETHIRCL